MLALSLYTSLPKIQKNSSSYPRCLGFIHEICVYNSWKIVDHCHLINIKGKEGTTTTTRWLVIRVVAVCVCVLEGEIKNFRKKGGDNKEKRNEASRVHKSVSLSELKGHREEPGQLHRFTKRGT